MKPPTCSQTLAIVGCGAVVEMFYAPALRGLAKNGWHLAFVDSARERAQKMAAAFEGASSHAKVDEVLGTATHAVVATPPQFHACASRPLLEAGIHVLCEKPFVPTPAEGAALLDIARRSGARLQVNQTRRWYPASIAARQAIQRGGIGKLAGIRIRHGDRFNWEAKTAFHSQVGSNRTGILSDQGSHLFDLVNWVTGHRAVPFQTRHDGYAGPEMTAHVDFEVGDARGKAIVTWLVEVPLRMEFRGTMGMVVLDSNWDRALLETASGTMELSGPRKVAQYSDFAEDILQALLVGRAGDSVATGASVLGSIEFLDKAYLQASATLPRVTDILSEAAK